MGPSGRPAGTLLSAGLPSGHMYGRGQGHGGGAPELKGRWCSVLELSGAASGVLCMLRGREAESGAAACERLEPAKGANVGA